jgi:exoribonuclease R
MGVWKKHEDLALLRSGFPLRFTREETNAAKAAFDSTHDPDHILGLRKDLRHMKVYTVDSASTSEIDDGLSIEVVKKDDGTERHRIWVHIADADRWAPRDSVLFETARRRITSLYLPHGSISMFPSICSADLMSLKANQDACALSMSVELNDDGSIDASSITFTTSVIRVSYRLTYDDVDEMLEEGIGYSEEWELGALLNAATKRRQYRIARGSAEGLVPTPVPFSSVSINHNKSAPDGIGISVNVQVSHNAGKNRTTEAESTSEAKNASVFTEPASSANLLVTEAMIMAGEALGRWKMRLDKEDEQGDEGAINQLRIPFRTQPPPGNFPFVLIVR